MVEVKYLERFGNNLCQYAIGRIISKQKDYSLDAVKPGNFDTEITPHIGSIKIEHPPLIIGRDHRINYDQIKAHKGKIIASGYFQDYENYREHKDYIKEFFSVKNRRADVYNDDTAVAHVRLTDYQTFGIGLPVKFYYEAFNLSKCSKLIVVTDDLHSPFITHLKNQIRGKVTVQSTDSWSDFVTLLSAKNLIISQSTFSWWAGLLSNATKIYYPISYKNYWGREGFPVCLEVTDESRYIYI